MNLKVRQRAVHISRTVPEDTTICTDLVIPMIGSALLAEILLRANTIEP
jgi:hypothetical protein